ncbi:MAG: hypothetical protein WKG06_21310 [Segetibacter sp.]
MQVNKMFNRAVYLVGSDMLVFYFKELVFVIATAAFFIAFTALLALHPAVLRIYVVDLSLPQQ